jgi:aspartate racemase
MRSTQNERPIVILGGVGPLAGVLLHQRIIENTLNSGTDQGHLEVHHYSRSGDIPDRTEYLLGRSRADPVPGMVRSFEIAAKNLSSSGAVVGIPCNTFHAPELFDRFLCHPGNKERKRRLRVLHMIQETLQFLDTQWPGIKRIGVLSTTGTRTVGIYETPLASSGYEVVQVPESEQDGLHQAIYDQNWGLKATGLPTDRAREVLLAKARRLVGSGAECIILGCTEIPLALTLSFVDAIPLLDPLNALARALIREVNQSKIKAYSPRTNSSS